MSENNFEIYKKTTFILLGLLIFLIGSWIWFFVNGVTIKSSDNRQKILLKSDRKELILGEMRTLLVSVNGIIRGLADDDYKLVESSAKSAGMVMAQDVNPALMSILPLSFKKMGVNVHKSFDSLAEAAKNSNDKKLVLKKLGEITSSCIACHSTYQLSSK